MKTRQPLLPLLNACRAVRRLGGVLFVLVMVLGVTLAATRAQAQCGPTWNTNFGNPGVSVVSAVSSIVEIPGGDLILGGSFTSIGGVSATNIARYNPSTGTYTPIGSGVNGSVSVLAVVPTGVAGAGDVIVGGRMSSADGVAVSGVARYSPGTNTWSALPGTFPLDSGNIRAIAVVPSGVANAGDIYVGGSFVDGGGVSQAFFIVRYVASTNTWVGLGPSGLLGMANTVSSIAVIPSGLPNAGQVIIGGFFERTRNQLANTGGIVRYNPANNTFAALGTGFAGTSPQINSIAILPSAVSSAGQVFVGGAFTQASGVAATNLASFNLAAGTWSSVGVAPDASVRTLSLAPNGTLYAGGLFSSIGGISGVGGIASYTFASSAWSSVGGTGPGGVSTIAARNTGEVFVGGSFTSVSGFPANGIARYFASFGGPTIVAQPQAVSVCPGGTATFSVAASSASSIAYQWRLNGVNITGNASATTSTLNLTNVTAAGTIDCLVSSGCSVASTGVTLSLRSAPAVTRNPSGVSLCPGASQTISIDATGTAPLTFQWRLNGNNINTATNPSAATSALTITNFQAANAGTYTCVVTNACGSATSFNGSGNLSLRTLPAITQSPSSAVACAGSSASFTVAATGSGPLSYQWRKGTTNLTNGGTISGATTATLTISTVATGDAAANYNCVVSNACSSATSGNATLTVNTAPSITAQPTNRTVCSGTSATFTVSAIGTPAPTFQWRKGTTNLTNSANISGATTATLTINAAGSGDVASNYNCLITSSCGSVTTSNAALSLNATTSIFQNPVSVSRCPGESATFSVTATGSGTLTYQWRRNGTNIDTLANPSAATSALVIASVNAGSGGTYDCRVTSSICGAATSSGATLTIASCRCNPADIAFDDGSPLPPVGTPGSDNNGVTEGDYNLFFATFFDAGAACDIANDDGSPLPPFGIFDTNNGVTEGDYNLFFAIFFDGCAL
ncbi:MAG: immunoglobulin domain-containing protein [Phycisphaerales bacterium]|nr:immunoglobulin domain-containing protein [Phycisphaerales bacterium]